MRKSEAGAAQFKAAVVGGTGYGGAELIRLLLAHPSVALTRVSSIDQVGKRLEDVHLSLHDTELTFEEIPLEEVARGVDVVFLGLPHKVPAKMAPQLDALACRVIDLSGDFRLRDRAAYATYYGGEHPHPEHLDGRWVFGLPEFNREQIRTARRVASPGCFATTIMLGLLPLARAGLLQGPVQTVASTGSSGSGAYPKDGTHHPIRANNLKSYKQLTHQHTPEISRILNEAAERAGKAQEFTLHFMPRSAPLARGILATSFVRLPESMSDAEVEALYRDFYEDAAFVRVLGTKRTAEVVAIKGSMWVDLSWAISEPDGMGRQLAVDTALDNLVKGGAGQAVQSMNLMLGLPERAGIDAPALWP
ncbi:MAG: N-acetyl-gamma-glutamyl-phosphate reductase [Planctomycetota bacterium]|nr:MAG: N-acetyl-gamma-glutamyl-phosphate reductase [Planctomycetota bacterium]